MQLAAANSYATVFRSATHCRPDAEIAPGNVSALCASSLAAGVLLARRQALAPVKCLREPPGGSAGAMVPQQAVERLLQRALFDPGIKLREAGQCSRGQTGLIYDDRRRGLEFGLHAHAHMVHDQAAFA